MNEKIKNYKFWIFCIILLALILRLIFIPISTFDHETTHPISVANSILEENKFIIYGFANIVSLGPLIYYLLLIPLIFTKNVFWISFFIAILNILGLILFAKLTKEFFNDKISLIATALLALNPWAIHYSTYVWNPNFIMPFMILFIYSLMKITIKNKPKYFITLLVSLVSLIQFHLSALFITPLIFLTFKNFNKLKVKYFLIGIIFSLVLISPYIYHNIKNDFNPIKTTLIYGTAQTSSNFNRNLVESFGIPAMLSTNYFGEYMFGTEKIFNGYLDRLFFIPIIILLFCLVLGTIITIKNLKSKKIMPYLILVTWILFPVIAFVIRNKNISPHYLLIVLPAIIIIQSIGLINSKKEILLKYFVITTLIILIIFNVLTAVYLYKNGGTNGAFGITYKNKLDVINIILKEDNPNIIFYKGQKDEIIYLLESKKIKYFKRTINSFEELEEFDKGAWIIIDDYSLIKDNIEEIPNNLNYTQYKKLKVIQV